VPPGGRQRPVAGAPTIESMPPAERPPPPARDRQDGDDDLVDRRSGGDRREQPRLRPPRLNLLWTLLLVYLAFSMWTYWTESRFVATIPYSRFEELLEQDRVQNLQVGSDEVRGELVDPLEGEKPRFRAVRVDEELAGRLRERGVEYTGIVENTLFGDLLWLLLPVLLMLGLWMFLFRRMAGQGGLGGGLMSVGKSKAKVYVEEGVKVRFDDVAGVDEAKEELQEIIGFLKEPGLYGRLGARLPRGILLVGPPGTGKTLLARAVAGESGVPFFSISGSEFVEMFVGVGAARVRDLFEQARKRAPCLIFIDELDALGRARGIGPMSGGHDEKEQTLNQLLVELDGFDPSQGVVLLAATNRPEILDPALLRAGRFDRQILVDRPDKQARIAILNVHLRKVDAADDVDPEQVASLTPGFTGADLANLVNEAAVLATRRQAMRVEMADFTAGMERIVAGLEKRNRLLNPHEREVVAYHEMGHALVSKALAGYETVHKVSIIPRGIGALGYTIQRPTEDRFLMSRSELLDKMAVLLGGRAAETVVFNEVSTGAADDLSKVSDIARSMVTRYGMDGQLGLVALENEPRSMLGVPADLFGQRREYSEQTAREVDMAVRAIVNQAFERAVTLLTQHREVLERGARLLLEKETLTAEELPELDGSPTA
jgi:cell division protease FtsH